MCVCVRVRVCVCVLRGLVRITNRTHLLGLGQLLLHTQQVMFGGNQVVLQVLLRGGAGAQRVLEVHLQRSHRLLQAVNLLGPHPPLGQRGRGVRKVGGWVFRGITSASGNGGKSGEAGQSPLTCTRVTVTC